MAQIIQIKDDSSDEDNYDVQFIYGKKIQKKKQTILYAVKWLDYSIKDMTWEPINHFTNQSKPLVKNFESSYSYFQYHTEISPKQNGIRIHIKARYCQVWVPKQQKESQPIKNSQKKQQSNKTKEDPFIDIKQLLSQIKQDIDPNLLELQESSLDDIIESVQTNQKKGKESTQLDNNTIINEKKQVKQQQISTSSIEQQINNIKINSEEAKFETNQAKKMKQSNQKIQKKSNKKKMKLNESQEINQEQQFILEDFSIDLYEDIQQETKPKSKQQQQKNRSSIKSAQKTQTKIKQQQSNIPIIKELKYNKVKKVGIRQPMLSIINNEQIIQINETPEEKLINQLQLKITQQKQLKLPDTSISDPSSQLDEPQKNEKELLDEIIKLTLEDIQNGNFSEALKKHLGNTQTSQGISIELQKMQIIEKIFGTQVLMSDLIRNNLKCITRTDIIEICDSGTIINDELKELFVFYNDDLKYLLRDNTSNIVSITSHGIIDEQLYFRCLFDNNEEFFGTYEILQQYNPELLLDYLCFNSIWI